MSQPRRLSRDLLALGLLALVLFLSVALATYDPADPIGELVAPFNQVYQPDVLVYPQLGRPANLAGWWGALSADLLFTTLGLGAYYVVGSLAVFVVLMLRRRTPDFLWERFVGWSMSLLGMTIIASFAAPMLSPGPVTGAGGYLGTLGGAIADAHFTTPGSLILVTSITLAGLVLCTDDALLRVSIVASRSTVHWTRTAGRGVLRRRALAPTIGVATVTPTATDPVSTGLESREPMKDVADRGIPVRTKAKQTAEVFRPEVAASENRVDDAAMAEKPTNSADDHRDAAPVVKSKPKTKTADKKDSPQEDPVVTNRIDPPLTVRKPHKLDKAERDEVREQLDEGSQAAEAAEYQLPDIDLLIEGDDFSFENQEQEVLRKAKILEETFASFGFNVKVVEIETGPVIAQYEIELEAGLRLSKITGLSDDLAIALRVPSVRIVAPIPGKNTVGIEVPNEQRQVVRLREVMEEAGAKTKKMRIPLFLGKDVAGNPLVTDLSTLPHLLIAGRTGTGKSVCLNAIISSILMTKGPDEVRMLMIDPKMVELSGYATLPHLMHPVVTDMKKAEAILAWAVDKMEERYALLARAGVRHICSYNQLGEEELYERLQPEDEEQKKDIPTQLPFIVIVADEIADLMMQAGKEVEQHIIRLAQKSRAVGIHLILATQKPTVDVITGLIKSNLPARICFQVASRTDSRVVLDEMGADKLLGNGDMLFLWPGTSTLLRGQGTYLTDEEINAVVDFVSTGEQRFVKELVNIKLNDGESSEGGAQLSQKDDLYESAVDIVVREGRGSVSLLQRALGIGYGRAARLIDYMAEDNIVGPYHGSKAREVLITLDEWERMQGHQAKESASRSRTIVPPRMDDESEPGDFEDETLSPFDDSGDVEDPWDHDEENGDIHDAYRKERA
jgi:S-DNA-T family DNA segregation ATPase FtsK/SpoIIIE